jgi:CheY-like chemotaxis protein
LGDQYHMASVLLIIDDPTKYRVSGWALEQDGYEVAFAVPTSAIHAVAESQPDVIVFNTALRVEVQEAFVQAIKSMAPSVRVLDLVDALGQPIRTSDSVLKEPCTPEDLSEKVMSLL